MVEGNNLPFPEEPDGEKSSNGLEPSREFRSKREIKPVVKLSYDELGKSTNRPIYTSRAVRYDDIYRMDEIKSLSFHIMFYRLFRGVAKYIVYGNTFSSFG